MFTIQNNNRPGAHSSVLAKVSLRNGGGMAGLRIEYCWGLTKRVFCRELNDFQAKKLHKILMKSIESLSLQTFCPFARKTRNYPSVYFKIRDLHLETVSLTKEAALAKEKVKGILFGNSYNVIKRMRKINNNHRKILDIDLKLIAAED